MDILDILTELNASNSSNYKKDILTKYKDNDACGKYRQFVVSNDIF